MKRGFALWPAALIEVALLARCRLETGAPGRRPGLAAALNMALALMAVAAAGMVHAEDPLCAEVKIEIRQKLNLERQGFDATLKINNGLPDLSVENVKVVVLFRDEAGNPVTATSDPNATGAAFFFRVDALKNLSAVDGTGKVPPKTVGEAHWLIIPAPGSGGTVPTGKLYQIGAQLTYQLGSQTQTVDVLPEIVTVRPQPALTLDYFLAADVYGDDPLTAETEPIEPFTLGLRVKNTGGGAAKAIKIESAQPKIVENRQGLQIGFQIVDGHVDDAPADKTLLLNLGDIAPQQSRTGRWNMTASLMGRFVDFSAEFSHADALGGAVTSLIQAVNAHLLLRDVKVDVPGRDHVRDFLAKDGEVLKVYESEGTDNLVIDRSADATLQDGTRYELNFNGSVGLNYVRVPDPGKGLVPLGKVTRSDGKVLPAENVWLSKSRDADGSKISYFINLFDADTPGRYQIVKGASSVASLAGVVFDDRNADGMRNDGEPGLGATAVTLTGLDDRGQNVSSTANADANGAFSFTALRPGTYALQVAAVANRVDGSHTAGSAGGTVATDSIRDIRLTAGTIAAGYLFAKKSSGGSSAQADLGVSVTADKTAARKGDTVIFTVKVNNRGPAAGTGVLVNALLPGGFEFAQGQASQGSHNTQTGAWTVGNLGANAEATLTYSGKVVAGGSDGNLVANAAVTASTTDPVPDNNSASVKIKVDGKLADLRVITLLSSPVARTGETVWLFVNVTNFGPDPAEGVKLRGSVPPSVAPGNASLTKGSLAGEVWTVGTLAPGEAATLKLPLTVTSEVGGTVQVQVAEAGTADDNSRNNSAVAQLNGSQQPADLSLELVPVQRAAGSAEALVTLVARNRGYGPHASVSVGAKLPAGWSLSQAVASDGTLNPETQAWVLSGFKADAAAALTLQLKPPAAPATGASTLAELAAAVSNDATAADNAAQVELLATPALGTADLAAVAEVSAERVAAGGSVSYVLALRNRGPATAANVVADVIVPDGFKLADAQPDGGSFDPATGKWTLGSLAEGAAVSLTLTGTVEASRVLEWFAHAGSDTADPAIGDNIAWATVAPLQADLAVRIEADRTLQEANQQVVFSVYLDNSGPDVAPAPKVKLEATPGLKFESAATVEGTFDAATGLWSATDLAARVTAKLTLTYQVVDATTAQSLAAQQQPAAVQQQPPAVQPPASAASKRLRRGVRAPDPDTDNNLAWITVNSPQRADLVVTAYGPATASAGRPVDYRIEAANGGPEAADGAQLALRLPDDFSDVTLRCLPENGAECPGNLDYRQNPTWILGKLPKYSRLALLIQGRLGAAGAREIRARLAPPLGTTDLSYGNNAAGVTTQVAAGVQAMLSTSTRTPPYRTPATLTVTLTPPAGLATPTGTVVLVDGQQPLAAGLLDAAGRASVAPLLLTQGKHPLRVEYRGDAVHAPAVSNTVELNVGSSLPAVDLSAKTLQFTGVKVGTESTVQTVTLTNSGTGPLAFTSIGLTGSHPADYLLKAAGCAVGTPLAPGTSCTLDVACKPTQAGARHAALLLKHNARPSGTSVALSSTAVAALENSGYQAPSPTGTGAVRTTVAGAGCQLGDVQYTVPPVTVDGVTAMAPLGLNFPHGIAKVQARGCGSGDAASFTLKFPRPVPDDSEFWVFGRAPGATEPTWRKLPALLRDDSVTVTLSDGGNGDQDGLVNGAVSWTGGLGTRR